MGGVIFGIQKKNEYLERSITDCNIRQIEGEGNERKFELSFSSEKPYMRYLAMKYYHMRTARLI